MAQLKHVKPVKARQGGTAKTTKLFKEEWSNYTSLVKKKYPGQCIRFNQDTKLKINEL